jgi:predicted nuclease with TOPRIM domain
MREQLEQRLHELKAEWETGQHMLAELETKQAHLRETLLRISGAVQVLEEMLAAPQPGHANGVPSPEPQDSTVTP